MKKKLSFIGLSLFALILAACGNDSNDNGDATNKAPAFDDVYENVENAVKEILLEDSDMSEDEMFESYILEDLTATDADESEVAVMLERMEIEQSQLANGKVIGALMNINADEIFVLEAKSEEDVADLKASLERELEAQIQTWEQYLPDQYEKVKKNVIETNGNFLLYATFSDTDKVADAFKAAFE